MSVYSKKKKGLHSEKRKKEQIDGLVDWVEKIDGWIDR